MNTYRYHLVAYGRLVRYVGAIKNEVAVKVIISLGVNATYILQAVLMARALASNPELLVMDEPLSSLDVSVQAQILNLLKDLKEQLHLTYILISHDPEVVYYLSDSVVVMYGGRVMEQIDRIEDFNRMRHPYTLRLLSSTSLYRNRQGDAAVAFEAEKIFIDMEAQKEDYPGCPYAGRCHRVTSLCRTLCPPLKELETGHRAACHQLQQVE